MKSRILTRLWLGTALLTIGAACGPTPHPQKTLDPNLAGPYSTVGRSVLLDGNSHLRMAWPGVALGTHFRGTGVQATLRDMNNTYNGQIEDSYWDVTVDGNTVGAPLHLTLDSNTYPVAHDLPEGEHTVWLTKRTEGMLGSSEFWGFSLGSSGGEWLDPPTPRARHIEMIGSSVEAGFGVGGTNCTGYRGIQQDQSVAYPQLLADTVEAELMNTSYSSKGLIDNLAVKEDPVNTMPVIYDQADSRDFKDKWDFSRWKADVVLIDLGGNDWNGLGKSPDPAAFTSAYVAFIKRIQANYPGVRVYIVLNTITHEPARSPLRSMFQSTVSMLADPSVKFFEFPEYTGSVYACDGHPTAELHHEMAQEISAQVKADLGW